MSLLKKIAKEVKEESELLALFFDSGGTIESDRFVPGKQHEARIALLLLGATEQGRKLLDDVFRKFVAKEITKRGETKKS